MFQDTTFVFVLWFGIRMADTRLYTNFFFSAHLVRSCDLRHRRQMANIRDCDAIFSCFEASSRCFKNAWMPEVRSGALLVRLVISFSPEQRVSP